jgi:molybdopterin converting factor subunit 1
VRVRVLFFGIVRERLGRREAEVELDDAATVADFLADLKTRHPAFAAGVSSVRVAVNGEYVDSATTLSDNDEVAVIPPVSGGVDVQDR